MKIATRMTSAAAGLAMAAGLLAGASGVEQAGARDVQQESSHCLVSEAGLDCSVTEREMEAQGRVKVATVYGKKGYEGAAHTFWFSRGCTVPTGAPGRHAIPSRLRQAGVESVKDYPGARCDWRLEGPNGGKSTWVENSWWKLQDLGDG